MVTIPLTHDANELVARHTGNVFRILAILFSITLTVFAFRYSSTVEWFKQNPDGCVFLLSFLFLSSTYSWYTSFDKRIRLVINKSGIWSMKFQQLAWDSIDAFYFQRVSGRSSDYFLWIDTKVIGESVKMDISWLDKDVTEIAEAISKNSKDYSIRYSGIIPFEQ